VQSLHKTTFGPSKALATRFARKRLEKLATKNFSYATTTIGNSYMRERPQVRQKPDPLISENKAAQLLERDRGTLKGALHGIAPDGFEGDQPRYKLATVMRVMAAHTRKTGSRSNVSPIEAELAALEEAAIVVGAFMGRIRAESDLKRRRSLAKSDGVCIGILDKAFSASITAQGSDAIPIYTPLRDQAVASAINELMTLCEWKIAA
jgi:hypothetical protein